MMGNGNIWSGFSTENHLGSIMNFPAESDYKDSFVRNKLLKRHKFSSYIDGIESSTSNYELIQGYLTSCFLQESQLSKLKTLLNSHKNKDYIMLMGLLKSILSKDGK